MQVVVDPTFPYPNIFLITGRVAGAAAPPVEKVGVFITKQTVLTDGTVTADQDILMADELFAPPPPADGEPGFDSNDLTVRVESDIVATKPNLDIAAARDSFQEGPFPFGLVRINRGSGFLPNPGMSLNWGWRSRLTGPRDALAGDAANFTPDVNDPLKMPDGFTNGYFNGGHLTGNANVANHLQTTDQVEFDDGTTARQVTIPQGPSLTITENEAPVAPAVSIDLGMDTVVYDSSAGHFLITWRAVFPWEDRLETAILEVA